MQHQICQLHNFFLDAHRSHIISSPFIVFYVSPSQGTFWPPGASIMLLPPRSSMLEACTPWGCLFGSEGLPQLCCKTSVLNLELIFFNLEPVSQGNQVLLSSEQTMAASTQLAWWSRRRGPHSAQWSRRRGHTHQEAFSNVLLYLDMTKINCLVSDSSFHQHRLPKSCWTRSTACFTWMVILPALVCAGTPTKV